MKLFPSECEKQTTDAIEEIKNRGNYIRGHQFAGPTERSGYELEKPLDYRVG